MANLNQELDSIAANLAEMVLEGECTLTECIREVLPFKYNLSRNEKAFVIHRIRKAFRGERQ